MAQLNSVLRKSGETPTASLYVNNTNAPSYDETDTDRFYAEDLNFVVDAIARGHLGIHTDQVKLEANGVIDSNGNDLLLPNAISSAVNHFQISNAASGGKVDLAAVGSDTNISMSLTPKGTGTVDVVGGITASGTLSVDGTGDSYIQGSLGIGTTSPGEKLQVEDGGSGDATALFKKTSTSHQTVDFEITNGDQDNYFRFDSPNVGEDFTIGVDGTNDRFIIHNALNRPSNIGSPTFAVTQGNETIMNGNVGIGTTSPAYLFDVAGPISARALSSDPSNPAANQFVLWQSDGTGSGADGDILIKVTDSNGTTKTVTLVDFSAN